MLPHDSAHRSPSADHLSANGEQKRKRKIFSCYNCRRMKLRCDRIVPICGRCQGSGNAASCVYDSPTRYSEEKTFPSTENVGKDNFDKIQRPESYGNPLRHGRPYGFPAFSQQDVAATKAGSHDTTSTMDNSKGLFYSIGSFDPASESMTGVHAPDEEYVLFRGKGFNTRYFGASDPLSVVSTSPSILKIVCIFQSLTLHHCTHLSLVIQDASLKRNIRCYQLSKH